MLLLDRRYQLIPASPKNVILALIIGTVIMFPGLLIGLLRNVDDPGDDPEHGNGSNNWTQLLLPAAVHQIGFWIIVLILRARSGKDLVEEASPDVDLSDAARNTLTNFAIVAALLLTVALAMVQADPPQNDPSRFLSQWYVYLCTFAGLGCLNSMVRSVILLVYVEPLGHHGSHLFINQFLDYFGEPSVQLMLATGNIMAALNIWIYGTYGTAVGVTVSVASIICFEQQVLAFLYAMEFRDPYTDRNSRLKKGLEEFVGKDPPPNDNPSTFALLVTAAIVEKSCTFEQTETLEALVKKNEEKYPNIKFNKPAKS